MHMDVATQMGLKSGSRGWKYSVETVLFRFLLYTEKKIFNGKLQWEEHRDVNFREFYFSIREFQISRLVEYSKLTRHSAWTTHLMRECCNSVDITPRGCGWAAAPWKWSDGREAVEVSNYKTRPSLSCTRVLSDPTDRPLLSQTHHTLWL